MHCNEVTYVIKQYPSTPLSNPYVIQPLPIHVTTQAWHYYLLALSSAEAFVKKKVGICEKNFPRGKEGKAGKRKRRENGKGGKTEKAEKASARFLSKYGKSCRYPTAHSLSAG